MADKSPFFHNDLLISAGYIQKAIEQLQKELYAQDNPQQAEPLEDFTCAAYDLAKRIGIVYWAFRNEGFTPDQSFELTLRVLDNILRGASI